MMSPREKIQNELVRELRRASAFASMTDRQLIQFSQQKRREAATARYLRVIEQPERLHVGMAAKKSQDS